MSTKGRDSDGRRVLPAEDRALWDSFTKPIKPLRKTPVAARDEPKPAAALAAKKSPPRLSPQPVPQRPPKVAPPPVPPLAPLGRRMKQRVARGREAIDGRLDLHGMTQSEAHGALLRFLQRASAGESRLVLVITGKSGVLRQQVPCWLGLPDLRGVVIGFEPASVRHGGDGALYVRLRRAR
jgi:DNA-nicking Smr family endonuclease